MSGAASKKAPEATVLSLAQLLEQQPASAPRSPLSTLFGVDGCAPPDVMSNCDNPASTAIPMM